MSGTRGVWLELNNAFHVPAPFHLSFCKRDSGVELECSQWGARWAAGTGWPSSSGERLPPRALAECLILMVS